ncbi:hypothetical protein [Fluviicola sp.]|uniref:hypothetical protein n=1 Tax=Fluviicola sp. TaxID=1917219 RepID=UPI00261A8C97|nr:hypothetical protein [Fluviicola sp.]
MFNQIKLILLTGMITFSHHVNSQTTDSIEIVKTFDLYQKALLDKNGVEVYNLLDKNTAEWYSYILEKVKYADSTEVSNLSLNDKMTVLSTRLIINKDSILQFDGRTFCIYITNKSIAGPDSGSSVKLKTVSVKDQKAKALVVATPEGDLIEFEFNKEKGVWKFNLSAAFHAENVLLKKYLSENVLSENEYTLYALEILSGKKPTNTIWNPLLVKSKDAKNR